MQFNKNIYEVKFMGGKNCLHQFMTGLLLAKQPDCIKGVREKSKSESRTEHRDFTVKTTNTVWFIVMGILIITINKSNNFLVEASAELLCPLLGTEFCVR